MPGLSPALHSNLVLFRRGQAEIDGRKNGKDVSLDDGHENVQADKGNRNGRREDGEHDAEHGRLAPSKAGASGEEAQEDHIDEVAGKHVGPETNREREDAGGGADELDGKQQNRQDPRAYILGGARKREQVVAETVTAHALPVEIEKREYRTAQRDGHVARRGFEKAAWKSAHKIAEENEHGNRADEGDEFDGAVVDILFQQVLDAKPQWVGKQHFGHLLHGAGLFDGKARTQNEGEDGPENYDDDSHHDAFRDGLFRLAWLNVQSGRERGGIMPEEMIHELRQPSWVFSHSSVRRAEDFPHTCHHGRHC